MKLLSEKFSRDVLWSFMAFAFMGITGILLNLIIGRFYGPEALGAFNQVYAVYIALSQFAVFGLWFSTLKHVPEHVANDESNNAVIISAIFLVFISSTIFTFATFLLLGPVETFFDSPAVAKGCLFILPGLWGYSVNKVFLAILNGHRNMKAFAGFQILRYIIIITSLILCVRFNIEGAKLPLVLSAPEIVLFVSLLYYTKRYYRWLPFAKWKSWLRIHLWFGGRSFLSGTMAELNTRVDVIMLGYFASDYMVGIYSMAALIAEGVSQLSVVLRDNLNPLFSRHLVRGEFNQLRDMIRRSIIWFYLFMAAVILLSVILYPVLIQFLTGGTLFDQSWKVYGILVLGISLVAGYLPLNMLLVQAGYPGRHLQLKAMVVLTNFVFNLCLIPLWGIYGAAIGTALSFVLSVFYLKFLVRKTLTLNI